MPHPEPVCERCAPGDPEEQAQQLAGVLRVYWAHHGRPATDAEAITQANALYHQFYPTPPPTEA